MNAPEIAANAIDAADRSEAKAVESAIKLSTYRPGAPFLVYRTPWGAFGTCCEWDRPDGCELASSMKTVARYVSGERI